MASLWPYQGISDQIDRSEVGLYRLQPASLVLFLAALSMMECPYTWLGNNGEVSSDEIDDIQKWVAQGYKDLLEEYTCPSGGDGMEIAQFRLTKPEGTAADYLSIGTTLVDWTEEHEDNPVWVSHSSGVLTLDAGNYLFSGTFSGYTTNRLRGLIKDSDDNILFVGDVGVIPSICTYTALFMGVEVDSEFKIYRQVTVGAGYAGIPMYDGTNPEKYGTLTIFKF